MKVLKLSKESDVSSFSQVAPAEYDDEKLLTNNALHEEAKAVHVGFVFLIP
jgi:hypothetical protein